MFRTGQQIGGYTLINRIGRGGFGEVWLAERRAKFATTQVAVKLPLDEQVEHATIEQEAKLWAQASGHPNVLPIIEADDYDGQIVIVSEYAPDGSLEQLLKSNSGLLPVKQAVELTIGILKGLEFLHSRKIIHRDLKPGNILLQGDTPRLADFGISRAMRTTSVSANIAGTPKYMAPEAFDGKRTVQTDIWSVGVLLYQMLTGKLPFPQEHYGELIGAIVNKEPAPLPETVSLALRKIVSKALSKNPSERYSSAREMREELSSKFEEQGVPTVILPLSQPSITKIKAKTKLLYFAIPAVVLLLFAIIASVYLLSGTKSTTGNAKTSPTSTSLPSGITAKNLIPFRKGDKFGFSDENKKLIIEPKYDLACFFNEGLAAVVVNKKIGFIDKEGNEVIPPKYERGDVRTLFFIEGLALVKINGKYGFIDKSDKEVTRRRYDDAQPFKEGFAKVYLDGNYGFIDKTGTEITRLKYDYVEPFSEGMAIVKFRNKYGFIDRTGKEVIPLKYESAGGFSDGLSSVSFGFMGQQHAYIDRSDNEVIRLKSGITAYDFSEGLARAYDNKTRKWGFIDKTGNIIIQPQYDEALSFFDGLARVKREGKYGFINKEGKEVILLMYDDARNFSRGLAAVKRDDKWGFIDKTDHPIIPIKYKRTLDFTPDGVTMVTYNGKDFAIDKDRTEYYEP